MIDRTPVTPYEAWVVTLRRWSEDPATPLNHLPALGDESLPTDAYSRLFEHLYRALERSGDVWAKALDEALTQSRDLHELADRLVKLRTVLARRLQLASHPGLPETVRDALIEDFTRMVERNQEELDTAFTSQLNNTDLPQAEVNQLIRTVRENSLLEVLNTTISQDGHRAEVPPLPDMSGAAPVDTPRRRRTILSD